MAYTTLVETWMGKTPEQITENWRPPSKPDDLDDVVKRQHDKLVHSVLAGIAKRAEDGDLDAVMWLEERHLVALPTRPT